MNPWYASDALIQSIENSPVRKEWCENGAYDCFYDLEQKLPREMRDRARIGALYVSEMTGTEGKLFWLFPVEGHKKILAPKSSISLLTKEGQTFFDGLWAECNEELVLKEEEFFIWLKPIANREKINLTFMQKIKGMWRRVRYAKK